jgi:hypothetical protein
MKTIYIVEARSGVHFGNCELGAGATRKGAIESAYGPGGRLPRHAWVSTLTEEEDPERFGRLCAQNGL